MLGAGIADIADVVDIATDITDIATNIVDIVNIAGICRSDIANIAVETSRHVQGVTGVFYNSPITVLKS